MAKKYSAKERKAFHMGRAFAAGKDGGRIVCPDEKTKQSFRNGVQATRERISGGGKKSVQAQINGGNKKSGQAQSVVAFVPGVGTCRINNDGCILEVL